MHLPDGSLSTPIWVAGDVLAACALGLTSRAATRRLTDRQVPLMGVLGAFVFAAQMINFPLPGGTSGHLIGGVLLAVLLGPAVSSVVMFCVLVIQALLFQDGGLTVLGPNFINMGLCGTLLGWVIFRAIAGKATGTRRYVAIFAAAWLAVEIGALLTALQLWLSGNAPLWPALVAMGSVHALVGVAEGLITVAAVRFLVAARPELLEVTA
jgi:cobalt/nickel transport system permease protein